MYFFTGEKEDTSARLALYPATAKIERIIIYVFRLRNDGAAREERKCYTLNTAPPSFQLACVCIIFAANRFCLSLMCAPVGHILILSFQNFDLCFVCRIKSQILSAILFLLFAVFLICACFFFLLCNHFCILAA